ncbi:MAG: DUF6798 domain-containing protein [Planctomycetota bacterium]
MIPVQPPVDRWAEVALVFLVFFIVGGEPAPHLNEQHYLARLKHFWDPQWCRGDLFLESPDAHFTIVWLVGWVTLLLPLPAVAWVGRIAAWAFLAWAWQRLSWAVAPARFCSVLAAAVWLVGIREGNLAGEWVVGGVEAKCFAYGFVLLGLKACVEDRWSAAWVHLGVATALHALVGGWCVAIVFALWICRKGPRPTFPAMAPALAAGACLGLLGVVPAIAMNWGTPAEVVAQANRIYVFDRLPHHLALLSKPDAWLLERGGRHAAVLALLAGVTAWAFTRRSVGATAPGSAALRRVCWFAWGAVGLAGAGLVIEVTLGRHPAAAASLQRYYWYRLTDVAAPLAVSLGAAHMIAQGVQRRSTLAVGVAVLAVVGVASSLWPVVAGRLASPTPPGDNRVADLDAWIDVCAWVRDNTPQDALFLVPRSSNSFKWRAERPEVVTQKDIPQDAASMVEWKRRLDEVFRGPATPEGRGPARPLHKLGAGRLRELGARYGASYVLCGRQRALSLPVAYRNRAYVVYQLPAAR